MKFKEENDEKIFGIKKGGLFFSNSIEVLFEHLKVHLFPEEMDLFSERILVTPSLGMQQWIQLELASSLCISCGFISTFLNKSIEILFEKIFCQEKVSYLPSQFELFLAIFHEIEQILDSSYPIWEPLISYIRGKKQRQIAVANRLAQLFERNGVYAHLANFSGEKQPANWQEALWAVIFKDWDYPKRVLQKNLQAKKNIPELSVHLFAFSHISPIHFYFFCKVSHYVPVYLYQLSPCQEFWSDLSIDHPSLLASLGKVGRETAKLFENSQTHAEDAYVIFGGNTQLKQLQRELLLYPNNALDSLGISAGSDINVEDDSLQVHISSTPHQEVENLYQLLSIILIPGVIEPKDVIVMAPQIAVYAPYIQSVFGKGINYQIADMPLKKNHQLLGGLILLLELEQKRWSVPAILELLEHPLFQKKQKFSHDDLVQIKMWIRQTGAQWAFDADHRESLLQKAHCQKKLSDGTATWMDSFGYLIEELALNSDRIHLHQAELLGNFITLLQQLFLDLKGLEIPKSLKDWVKFLKQLLDTYFILSDDFESVILELEKIAHADKYSTAHLNDFSVIYFILNEFVGKESVTLNRSCYQAVRFCSLLPMRAVPAKVICLLGMNHDAFPRRDELQAFDLLNPTDHADYFPSRGDFDRYLFLEAILSARCKLIISYLGKDPYDLTELPPSSVVAEFIRFLGKTQIYKHPMYEGTEVRLQPALFSVKAETRVILPKGEMNIEVSEMMRLIRSPLRHYLYAHSLRFEDSILETEEAFSLSALKKSILSKVALQESAEAAFNKGKKEGFFPLGTLGKVARMQMQEEFTKMRPKQVMSVEINSLPVKVNENLTIIFSGTVEGVCEAGLCIPGKKSFKNVARAWPKFLLLKAQDPTKKSLFFSDSEDSLDAFFEDPKPFLIHFIEFFFFAKQCPLYLALDWLEPILKKESEQLEQTRVYDPVLEWQLRGKEKINYSEIVSIYHPWVAKLYKEMVNVWF